MLNCKDCKKKTEEKATIYFIDDIEGPIYLCKYCANIRKEWWENGWKEVMGAKMYDGNEKVDMTFKELHEAKDNYFKYGYQSCMEDMIRNFVNDLNNDDSIIVGDFKDFLSEVVSQLEAKEKKCGGNNDRD